MERYLIRFIYSGGEQIVGRGDADETVGLMRFGIISLKPCNPNNKQKIKVAPWGNNRGVETDDAGRTKIL